MNDTQQNNAPVAVQAQCFTGNTMLVTTRGNYTIQTLMRMMARRDESERNYAEREQSLRADLAARLDNITQHSAEIQHTIRPLQFSVTSALHTAVAELTARYEQEIARVQSERASEYATIVPPVLVRDPESGEVVERALVKVWASGEVTELVDVVIDVTVVTERNTERDFYVKVRCTPEHVFITPNGDVQACDLAGKPIWQVHPDGAVTEFVVPSVIAVHLDEPTLVYDAQVEGIASYCVAPDGGAAAVVHNSTFSGRDVSDGDETSYMPDTGTREYSTFIHKSRYARWLEDRGRRETWGETVARYFGFMREKLSADLLDVEPLFRDLDGVEAAVLGLSVVPSMRALWSAGPSLKRCNVAGYNCAYVAVDSPRVFDEAVYILMSGCGLGFSVERQYVSKLPTVAEEFADSDTTIHVGDSRTGWAKAYRELISLLYAGQIPKWDLSKLRPAGAKLRTSGGRSSGPRPLDDLFSFTVKTLRGAAGRKLSSIEAHDLMCMIGRIVVAGGVRRSAEISLSNPSDDRLRHAKSGQWWIDNEHRALANNSIAYTERPDFPVFMREWWALYESKSGERGIYNRVAAHRKAVSIGREPADLGTNPCAEIALRSMQFCNLTEVVVRATDTIDDLVAKVRHAAILGTLQSDLLDLKYLRKKWRDNCGEERLLGVSLTGITDHPVLGDPSNPDLPAMLLRLREMARETNREWAERIGIPASKAVTTVKPSGTVSQLVNSSSGIHPRFAPYYIRRVRADHNDPLAKLMQSQGFPCEVDSRTPSNLVFSFPVASPRTARFAENIDALTQAKLWRIYAQHWADHSVSCTIYYSDDEFLGLGQWVWEHFDEITGLSFLPRSDHTYVQAPYEAITREQYNALLAELPTAVDWSRLAEYESEDQTQGARTLACTGDVCEIVDL